MLRDEDRNFIRGAAIFNIIMYITVLFYCDITKVEVPTDTPLPLEPDKSIEVTTTPPPIDWDTIDWNYYCSLEKQREENRKLSDAKFEEYTKEHPIPEYITQKGEEKEEEEKEDVEIPDASTVSSDENFASKINYNNSDLFKFEATLYSECGAQGTSNRVLIANAWIARNKIEQEMAQGSPDPFRSALNPYSYEGVFDDYLGWRAQSRLEGVISQELINSNPSVHEISIGVLNGTIESPIYDWDSCICTREYDFNQVVDTANSLGIKEFFVIENGIFFPSSEWNERIDNYLLNF